MSATKKPLSTVLADYSEFVKDCAYAHSELQRTQPSIARMFEREATGEFCEKVIAAVSKAARSPHKSFGSFQRSLFMFAQVTGFDQRAIAACVTLTLQREFTAKAKGAKSVTIRYGRPA